MRRRDLLHANSLGNFLLWAQKNGYLVRPRPPKAHFEVARLEKYSPSGNNPHIVIYRRMRGDHLTVEGEGVKLVNRWIRERKNNVGKKQALAGGTVDRPHEGVPE